MIDDMEMDQFDYDAAVRGFDSIAPTLATTSLDKNPDDGVRALEISKATGIPAPAVLDDLDGYDSQLKAGLTSRIVSDNDVIAEYLRENPLADVVSNDDYGNMDNFARTVPGREFFDKVIAGLEKTPAGRFLIVPAGAGIAGAAKGAFEAFTVEKPDYGKIADAPLAVRAAYGGADLGLRIIEAFGGAVSGGAMEAAGKFAEEVGADVAGIERAKRDALAFVEDIMGRASHMQPERIAEADITRRATEGQAFADQAIAQTDALNRARPWVESGMEPPTRTAPEIDALKAEVNFNAVEAIYANHDAALQMLTKERSPELAAAYIKKFYGENSIGIPAERIAELYGDSVPEAGDGILGWVPDLAQQLEDGLATGGDVRIPLADWIANVDPQVANGLKPDMRVWSGGITATEAAGKVEPKAVVEAPIAQARAALGTEPLVGFGDRKFTVQAVEAPEVFFHGTKEKFETFDPTIGSTAGSWLTKDKEAASAFGEPGAFTVDVKNPASMMDFQEARIAAGEAGLDIMEDRRAFNRFVIDYLEAKGFDGIRDEKFKGAGGVGRDVVAAFRPEQIQAAKEIKGQKLQFLGDTGEPIGELTVVPEGNRLRVEDVSGDLGMYADTIGPSSFVDIAKQLKGMFPEAEELVVGEDIIPLNERPLKPETYNKTRYALSKINEDKIVSELVADVSDDPAIESAMIAAKEQFDTLRASQAGLSKKTFNNLQKLVLARHEADLKAHLARVERMQRKTQTKEWKAAEVEVRKAVADKISQRPDVLADALIGSGELAGKKLKQVYPLREDALTPEQKVGLPRHYYSKDGIVPDMVAGMFGYPSGDMMVNDIIKYNVDRGNKSAKEHLKSVIDAETQRAMNWMYGKLDENIMRDAIDQATSEMDMNLVLEEWQGFAMENGIETISKEALKAEAQEAFGRLKAGDVSLTEMQRLMISHLEKAKDFLAAQDYESAVKALEQRSRVKVMLTEAKKFDKTKAAFEKTAKRFSKRVVEGAEPEYTNWIHHILMRVGKGVRRSAEDLRKEIDATGSTTLESFVAEKTSMFREVAVWDELFDESWSKNIDNMTVDQYRAVADSIKSLVFHATDERKIYRGGDAADLADIKKRAIDGIYKSAAGAIAEPTKGVGRKLKTYYVAHLQTENVLNRWDGFDPNGTWNQYIMRDLIDGANQIDAWKKEYAKKFKGLSVPKNIRDSIDNTLFYDRDTYAPIKFTRKNLIAVMLNTGTGTGKRSNLHKLAKGYGLEPEAVMKWIDDHATAEDWKLVREIWDIFADIKKKSDTMYRSLSGGVPAEDLPTYPIMTKFGEMAGGYYPIFWHSEMEGKSTKLMGKGALEGEGYYRATTPAGYTKSRTGYIAPMALDFDHLPGRISQMLQDIGLRPAIINASKLFYDHDVRSAIRRHYGVEYKDMLQKYLEGVANSGNNWSLAQREMSQVSELIRQNLISTLVGLNPGTVLKHFPSAAVTSIREVGPQRFLDAMYGMFRTNESTGESNWQFAISNSLELQRRDRNWEETLFGASTGALSPGEFVTPWRQRIIEWSSKPVALSDMISAVPTWLAEYGKQMDAGETHGDAVYMADRAVRRAHGSTAVTTRTQVMREYSGWLTSVYNFFSDIMNRQMETMWRAGEMSGKAKEGDMKGAVVAGGAFTASLFAYAIWPAIVEHMVSGQAEDEHESWGATAAKAGLRTAASSWVGVRDFTNWMLYGNDPQFGMAGTAMKEIGQLMADLKKDHPLRKDHMGRMLQDAAGFIGTMTGMMPQQIGKSARYIHDVNSGIEHPKGPWTWAVGLRFGTTKGHSQSWEDFVKGKVRK